MRRHVYKGYLRSYLRHSVVLDFLDSGKMIRSIFKTVEETRACTALVREKDYVVYQPISATIIRLSPSIFLREHAKSVPFYLKPLKLRIGILSFKFAVKAMFNASPP